MESVKETVQTVQGRLSVLKKALVSEENSVQYYETLLEKTSENSEEDIGTRRMYQDLADEEKKHVETIQSLIQHWEGILKELEARPS